MLIEETITWRGRAYRVRGFDPMGVTDPAVHLEDAATGEWLRVPFDDLVAGASSAITDQSGGRLSGEGN
jgi:hypothetical protein